MTQIHPTAQKGFSSAAELYQQVRPSYPQELTNWLKGQLQIQKNDIVVDLGAGTGKFIPYLQDVCSQVIAVEPVAEMLSQLQQHYPEVQTLQASSQNLPLATGTVDAVICAQSFHWFADLTSLQEIHRILKPAGHLGLIWNQRDIGVDWVKALADLIEPFEGNTPRYHRGQWREVLKQQTLFHRENLQIFEQKHVGSVEQVVSKRLLSTSFIAAMPTHQQQQFKQQFEKIVQDYTGKSAQDLIEFPYVTYAYHWQKV